MTPEADSRLTRCRSRPAQRQSSRPLAEWSAGRDSDKVDAGSERVESAKGKSQIPHRGWHSRKKAQEADAAVSCSAVPEVLGAPCSWFPFGVAVASCSLPVSFPVLFRVAAKSDSARR